MLSDYFLSELYPFFESRLRNKISQHNYRATLEGITDFIGKDFLCLTEEDVYRYIRALLSGEIKKADGKPFTRRTVMVRLSMLRSVGAFLEENAEYFELTAEKNEDFCPCEYVSPFRHVTVEDTPDFCPEDIPPIEDIDLILRAAPNLEFRVIFYLALRCGLTASEIVSLRYKDFITDADGILAIRFNQPGGEERFVKIPEDIYPEVAQYLSIVSPQASRFFLNANKRPFSVSYLHRLVRNICLSSGASTIWTLKDLRNACVAHMLCSGAEASEVAAFTGTLPKWIKRYDRVIEELKLQPCDLSCIRVLPNQIVSKGGN